MQHNAYGLTLSETQLPEIELLGSAVIACAAAANNPKQLGTPLSRILSTRQGQLSPRRRGVEESEASK